MAWVYWWTFGNWRHFRDNWSYRTEPNACETRNRLTFLAAAPTVSLFSHWKNPGYATAGNVINYYFILIGGGRPLLAPPVWRRPLIRHNHTLPK